MDIGKHFGSSSGKANEPKKEPNYKKIPWHQLQCSGSSQIPSQNDPNYHQFLSLYYIAWRNGRSELIICNTENKKEEIKVLDNPNLLDEYSSITQLPNGELFCYGGYNSVTTVIIDRSYGVRMLPSGAKCDRSSALYFDNNIYCFGSHIISIKLSNNIWQYDINHSAWFRKFDLKRNRWINLSSTPHAPWEDNYCHSVIFNGNILISGIYSENLWLYSIEIDSFSIIPYDFACNKRKVLINIERLFLIEWGKDVLIYESEDEYHLKPISAKGRIHDFENNMYCLYNKGKIHISIGHFYYQFDLKKKFVRKKHQILKLDK